MTDRPHPDLDAPLSSEEAAEARRVEDDNDCCWLDPGDRMYCPGAAQCACECHRQKRATRREWETLRIQDFERLESENAALVAEVRRLRAAQAAALAWARDRGYLEPNYADEEYPCDELWTAMIDALRALTGGTDTSDARCPHGHVGCCGHHDLEDMPIHEGGDCR